MPSIQTDYHVADKEVKISVVIGEAQIGSSLVMLDEKEKAKGEKIVDCSLGNGPDLKGKTLLVKTTVNDVSDKTNLTSVTYQLKGGKEDANYLLDATVANEGDSMLYRATFKMV
jgi:hypothetical protein